MKSDIEKNDKGLPCNFYSDYKNMKNVSFYYSTATHW